MKNKKILGIFSTNLLIWFHYILLIGVLYLSYYIGDLIFSNFNKWYIMLPWFFIWISFSDQLIHKILGVD